MANVCNWKSTQFMLHGFDGVCDTVAHLPSDAKFGDKCLCMEDKTQYIFTTEWTALFTYPEDEE